MAFFVLIAFEMVPAMACILLMEFEMVLVMASFHIAHDVRDGFHGDHQLAVAHGTIADCLDVCDGVLQFHWTQPLGFVFCCVINRDASRLPRAALRRSITPRTTLRFTITTNHFNTHHHHMTTDDTNTVDIAHKSHFTISTIHSPHITHTFDSVFHFLVSYGIIVILTAETALQDTWRLTCHW